MTVLSLDGRAGNGRSAPTDQRGGLGASVVAYIIVICIWSLLFWTPSVNAAPKHSRIEWQDWSADLFERAKAQGRFVLLDLEAVWCHWCHVMDAETYGAEPVADLIKQKYIAVRVDQDANPDLSNRYGNWGWPATIVFAPDGTEIVKRRGFIPPLMMVSLLQAIIDDPSPGPSIVPEAGLVPARTGALSATQRRQLEDDFWRVYDSDNGGWGNVHKYLDGPTLDYALTRAATGDRLSETMARQTLGQGLKLIDPVWGGVFQYSDQVDWRSPHYEKIMVSQVHSLRAYAQAHLLWGDKNPRYLEAAMRIRAYLRDHLRGSNGGFFTSQDADVDAQLDGKAFYGLDASARLKLGKAPRIDRNQYARENGWVIAALTKLYDATNDVAILEEAQLAAQWAIANRANGDGSFRHAERDRSGPYLGDTVSMASGFLALYASTGEREWLSLATDALDFVDARLRGEAGFLSHPVPANAVGVFATPVLLVEENVDLVRTAVRAHGYSGEERYGAMAEHGMRYLASTTITENRLFLHGVSLADVEMTKEPVHITVVGAKENPQAQALHAAARAYPAGYKRVEWWDRREGDMPNPDVQYPKLDRPAAFACSNRTCSLPVFEPAKVHGAVARLQQVPK
ncbi:MAG: thioredoxin domain-containing protein [Chromatiales bacterium]|nr:thioredoxin domain-containing protein [Chromatiales bacterium]